MRGIRCRVMLLVLLTFAVAAMTVSCERTLGYGVLLWTIPERGLMDGDVLKICIKSNISHVWVAQKTGEHENSSRFEVPLWQLTEPVRRKKAEALAAETMEYHGKYASVGLDALPVREEATNSSKRVYRLRQGEVVHILGEYTKEDGQMEIPTNGGVPLEGKWLKVITKEGTQGWCFSYNLKMFVVNRGDAIEEEAGG